MYCEYPHSPHVFLDIKEEKGQRYGRSGYLMDYQLFRTHSSVILKPALAVFVKKFKSIKNRMFD